MRTKRRYTSVALARAGRRFHHFVGLPEPPGPDDTLSNGGRRLLRELVRWLLGAKQQGQLALSALQLTPPAVEAGTELRLDDEPLDLLLFDEDAAVPHTPE